MFVSNIIYYIEYGFMAMSYCRREGINNCKTNEVNFFGIPTRRKSSYSGVSDAISLSHVLYRAIFCVSYEKVLCTVGKYKP